MSREVVYKIQDEVVGEPSFKVDETNKVKRISEILSSLTEINEEKLQFFINNYGIENVLNNPSIMGITIEQTEALKNLRNIMQQIGE